MDKEAFAELLAQYRDAILNTERVSLFDHAIWETQHEDELRKKVLDTFSPS